MTSLIQFKSIWLMKDAQTSKLMIENIPNLALSKFKKCEYKNLMKFNKMKIISIGTSFHHQVYPGLAINRIICIEILQRFRHKSEKVLKKLKFRRMNGKRKNEVHYNI